MTHSWSIQYAYCSKLSDYQSPFYSNPSFFGGFWNSGGQKLGVKSGYFISEKEPPLFKNPPKFREPDRSIISVPWLYYRNQYTVALSLNLLKLKLEMFYDDEIKFSSCFPPKTGITNWLKALIKQKHKYKQIKTLKDIFYDLPRYERSGLRERFEMKSGINDYVSFLTVRHPFSRILSAYRNWYHSNCSRLQRYCWHFEVGV